MAVLQARQLTQETSDAIRVARVLCILSMISVHLWPGASNVLHAEVPRALHLFYLVVIDFLGRGSVPLLSTVSGVLLTFSAARARVPLSLLGGKARTFLVPMVIWSAVMVALALAHAAMTGDQSDLPQGTMGWINSVFALTAPPANLPLAFLRDVFVAMAIGLLAIGIHRKSPLAAVLLLVAVALFEGMTGGVLLLRPQIMVFFTLGVLIAWGEASNFAPSWLLVLGVLLVSILVLRVLPHVQFGWDFLQAYLNRIAMMLLMWRVSLSVVRGGGGLHRAIRRLEPLVFTVFCTHMIVVSCVAAVAGPLGIHAADPVYPLLFLAQFPLAVGFAAAVVAVRRKVIPKVFARS